jgi:hypothetical protein
MSTLFEIISRVTDYTIRKITLSELEEWLTPRLRIYLANPDNNEGQLTALVELCLAEFQDGIRFGESDQSLTRKSRLRSTIELVRNPGKIRAGLHWHN